MARGKLSDSNRLKAIERRHQAFIMRLEGKSYREIANDTGVSLRQAWEDVNTALKEAAELDQDKKTELRQLELERLDALYMAHWKNAKTGDSASSSIVLKVMERRAKLLGLDAPTETKLSGDSLKAYINIDMDKV